MDDTAEIDVLQVVVGEEECLDASVSALEDLVGQFGREVGVGELVDDLG